jgi:hypothetical protein
VPSDALQSHIDDTHLDRCRHGLLRITCAYCSSTSPRTQSPSEVASPRTGREYRHSKHGAASPRPRQPFPRAGTLAANLNLSLAALRDTLRRESGPVYCYVETSIKYGTSGFVQEGSGPNFQGDLVTLCTCKHSMRSSRELSEWPGVWIAGFTSVSLNPAEHINYLAYLMKVAEAYPSQIDLWNALPPSVREAKAADRDRLGDLYRPKPSLSDPFGPQSYVPPLPDHSHCDEWQHDLDSVDYGRRPSLLVGDRRFSFLWSQPLIALAPPPLSRGFTNRRFPSVRDLLHEIIG